jgi:hypothetical protein
MENKNLIKYITLQGFDFLNNNSIQYSNLLSLYLIGINTQDASLIIIIMCNYETIILNIVKYILLIIFFC